MTSSHIVIESANLSGKRCIQSAASDDAATTESEAVNQIHGTSA